MKKHPSRNKLAVDPVNGQVVILDSIADGVFTVDSEPADYFFQPGGGKDHRLEFYGGGKQGY